MGPRTPSQSRSVRAGSISCRNNNSSQTQTVANHKILQDNYKKYLAVQEVIKDIIKYAVGSSPIGALKEPYIGYRENTVKEMFAHLYNKAAVKMTEAEKQEYKESVYKQGWDGTTELSAYFANLTRSEDTLPQ